MVDYNKLEKTHHLSAYEVVIPIWQGTQNTRLPFAPWNTSKPLDWYQAYNEAKHDRHAQFPRANFQNLLDAVCGLVALLSSQFHCWSFSPRGAIRTLSGVGGPSAGYEVAIGDYFHVKFPSNFTAAEQYDFNWQKLVTTPSPVDTIPSF
jgi:hypothetical protein